MIMATLTVTGTVTDTAGLSTPFNGTITTNPVLLPPIIDSVTVAPDPASVGTLRTITILAHDPNSPALGLVYTCLVNGVPATPTAQPNVFTVVA